MQRSLRAFGAIAVAIALGLALALNEMHHNIESIHPSPINTESDIAQASISNCAFPEVNWQYWQSANANIVAWISIPGTSINYPIVQAPENDPDYYNFHDMWGQYSIYGCPYLSSSNSKTGILNSKNAVIQGHNISDSSHGIFADLANFADKEFAEEHGSILLQTPNEQLELRVFAVEIIPHAENAYLLETVFTTKEEFKAYRDQCISRSILVFESNVTEDQMWSFSTCSYFITPENERTVIYCSKAPEELDK